MERNRPSLASAQVNAPRRLSDYGAVFKVPLVKKFRPIVPIDLRAVYNQALGEIFRSPDKDQLNLSINSFLQGAQLVTGQKLETLDGRTGYDKGGFPTGCELTFVVNDPRYPEHSFVVSYLPSQTKRLEKYYKESNHNPHKTEIVCAMDMVLPCGTASGSVLMLKNFNIDEGRAFLAEHNFDTKAYFENISYTPKPRIKSPQPA